MLATDRIWLVTIETAGFRAFATAPTTLDATGATNRPTAPDDPDALALWLTQLGTDIEVLEGDDLRAAFARLTSRFLRAAAGTNAIPRSR